ncbi:E3 ubiquitin-protein ligase TRIM39-like [Mastacembelus armatus]|uniref:E3 ubiquitin-protein ligase TRIM39-like n=1 Tax=Mastacembelus armatus TaxID=205130 RepID=A0A3Q3LLQ5_9TELE|nr:E3 ubiquitin-protein ligase TRIM39-like [Mastacembelus armatus]
MASASSLPCDEQFLCSICLGDFNEPVSTPCGHNYCKACITGYWASSGRAECPLCKKKFHRRPQLQVNTEFRDMVEHFHSMRVKGEDKIPAKQGEVPCDICLGPKLKAQKTCLVCMASYCQSHLEPHQRVPTLKKHKLIDPVSDLEDRVCKKHDKMFEFYCHEDQTCVCFMCLIDDHATHETIPLEKAFRDRKDVMDNVMSEIKMMENTKSKRIKEIKCLVKQSKKESEKEVQDITEVLTAPLALLNRNKVELLEMIQEKQKVADRQTEAHVTQLEQDVAELTRRRSELEQLLKTEDHLRLLQKWPSLCSPGHLFDTYLTEDLSEISRQSYLGMVKKAVAKMEKTLSNEMEKLTLKVRFSDGCDTTEQLEAAEEPETDVFNNEVWTPPQDKLMMIQQCDAVDVTLDAYTAHSKLSVSEDGKQLSFHEAQLLFPPLFGNRFQNQTLVLGKDGFSSGRFYYEVQVDGSQWWVLGVVKEPINREVFFFPGTEEGGWTFGYCGSGHIFFSSDANFPLYVWPIPRTVGVFVDYEKGEVSCYNVDTRTLIYSFTRCTFTQTVPPLKAFLYSMVGTSLSSRPKLYPIFGIFGDVYNNRLQITPVGHAT